MGLREFLENRIRTLELTAAYEGAKDGNRRQRVADALRGILADFDRMNNDA